MENCAKTLEKHLKLNPGAKFSLSAADYKLDIFDQLKMDKLTIE